MYIKKNRIAHVKLKLRITSIKMYYVPNFIIFDNAIKLIKIKLTTHYSNF